MLPGLIDMHAHPAPADWKYGMDADADVLPRGTTTMLSQGDAGAAVWDAYYEDIVAPARARILMAISPAVQGESEHRTVFGRLEDVDPDACVQAIERGGPHIWGISINASPPCTGDTDPREVMRRTLDAAERTRGSLSCTGPASRPANGRFQNSSICSGAVTWSHTASATAYRASSPAGV